jgi:hypothetical protein
VDERAFQEAVRRRLDMMIVRMTPSVSRSLPLSAAYETIDIVAQVLLQQRDTAEQHLQRIRKNSPRGTLVDLLEATRKMVLITSIDFSGNAYKHSFREFMPLLQRARDQLCLAITLHAGEKDDDSELNEMIEFGPDRWGHLVFAGPDAIGRILSSNDVSTPSGQSQTRNSRAAPIELCITSNMLTTGHTCADEHHFPMLLDSGCLDKLRTQIMSRIASAAPHGPEDQAAADREEYIAGRDARVSFNTDDRGVFLTSLSKELSLVVASKFVQSHIQQYLPRIADSVEAAVSVAAVLQHAALAHAFPPPSLLCEGLVEPEPTNDDSVQLAHYSWLRAKFAEIASSFGFSLRD